MLRNELWIVRHPEWESTYTFICRRPKGTRNNRSVTAETTGKHPRANVLLDVREKRTRDSRFGDTSRRRNEKLKNEQQKGMSEPSLRGTPLVRTRHVPYYDVLNHC